MNEVSSREETKKGSAKVSSPGIRSTSLGGPDKVLIAEFKFDYLQHADLIETLNKKGITHACTAMMTPAVSSWLTEATNQIIPV